MTDPRDQFDWRPPPALLDLRRAGIIAIDVETRDGGWPHARAAASADGAAA